VENRENLYYRMPFYMTYPMQNLYLTEMEYEKDMERMKELYPREVRKLQEMIERRCDEMEYEGSRMYDENPDRYMLEEEARRLYERFLRENPQYNMMTSPGSMSRPMQPRPDMPMEPRPMQPRPNMSMEPRPMQSRSDRSMESQPMSPREDIQMQQRGRDRDDGWLRSLIHILFHDEIYRRRCRNRRCRRWW